MPRLELTLLQPPAPPVKLDLDRDVITAGRSTSCAIPINNRYRSRTHAEIVSDGDGWVLRDRIQAPVRLGPGDHIQPGESAARTGVIHRLALELIADRPMAERFEFILDRVVDLMRPSRAALALLNDEDQSLTIVTVGSTSRDGGELAIIRTLVREVVQERKVVVFKAAGRTRYLLPQRRLPAR